MKDVLSAKSYWRLRQAMSCFVQADRDTIIGEFSKLYRQAIKQQFQEQYSNSDSALNELVSAHTGGVKAIWGDCQKVMKLMKSESVQLIVTSPPYYNARQYSQWGNISKYLSDMRATLLEAHRILDNHRLIVLNIGDVVDNDNLTTRSSWGSRRIPLGAYFIRLFEETGYSFIDDIIWDKGEPQSNRHKNRSTPYPLYQYPVNCYEHLLVFRKDRQDDTKYPCPVCGCLQVSRNGFSAAGIVSWECKNLKCLERSKAGRGKRFSLRSITMSEMHNTLVPEDLVRSWRRDIVKFPPVIKINSHGENILGHTAPFPFEIPEFTVKTLTREGEIVLDPFSGSFTSAIAAVKLGRIGVGIELNKNLFSESVRTNISQHGLGVEEYDTGSD